MDVKRIIVGPLMTNCYILSKNNKAIIIDPGSDSEKIIDYITSKKLTVSHIIVTHNHFDHIDARDSIKNYYNVEVLDHSNLEEKEYHKDNFNYQVIYTKGHTSDSITIYFKEEKIMFVGDFIFKNGIGRVDLPTGNMNEMIESLNMIKKYPSDIIIYPGHGEATTLKEELL